MKEQCLSPSPFTQKVDEERESQYQWPCYRFAFGVKNIALYCESASTIILQRNVMEETIKETGAKLGELAESYRKKKERTNSRNPVTELADTDESEEAEKGGDCCYVTAMTNGY